jgi:hypothetical protein
MEDSAAMKTTTLLTQIAAKQSDKDAIADRVVRQPELLPEVFSGLESDRPEIKYGCLKVLRLASEQSPASLYPHVARFLRLLDADNTFLKWGAILIIGNLAAVDSRRRLDRVLDKFLRPIRGPVMITAANVIGSAAKIALAKPALAETIARQILKVARAEYETNECRNVAIGHAVNSLDQFYHLIRAKRAVEQFVRRQLANSRSGTRHKAEAFLKRHAVERCGTLQPAAQCCA